MDGNGRGGEGSLQVGWERQPFVIWNVSKKSCKRFGVKNAHRVDLSAKIGAVWAMIVFCGQKAIFVGKTKCIISL